MTDLVIDASALVLAVAGTSPAASKLRGRISAARCHAPHLIDAEVGNVLRRQELAGFISPALAHAGLRALPHLIDERYPHSQLAEAAWRLRGSLTFYDALYVVLATALKAPLVTSDARLNRAPKLPCQVELIQ